MPGDDDPDEFFGDELVLGDDDLQQIDSVIIQASQAPRPEPLAQPKSRLVTPKHHVVARPANRPSQASTSRSSTPQAGPSRPIIPTRARQAPRDPGPLNTEPRAGGGGFGWEHDGKRQIDAERYIAQVDDRQQYWRTGGMSNQNDVPSRGRSNVEDDDDDEPPMVEMNPNGTYRHVPTPDVVDKHAKPSIALPVARKKEDSASAAAGAEARRRAMMAAMQLDAGSPIGTGVAAAGPGPNTVRQMTKSTSGPVQHLQQQHNPSQRFPSSNSRTLSRSISAGHHPVSKPLHHPSKAMSPQLATIPAEPSQSTPPASQGSLARKAALEADSIQRAKEALEKELATVKQELEEERRRAEAREKKENEAAMREERERKPLNDDGVDWKKKYEEERNKVFTSEGAASSARRKMQTMAQEHKARLDKMQADLEDMALKAKEKERDTARQLENVKTQAVFSNHAVLSSAIKRRHDTGSQRPPGSPSKFVSPRGKAMEESFLQRTAGKGKGRAMLPPPEHIVIPQPKFTAFNNAFNTSPGVSRVKRQRTESVAPQHSPLPSPSRRSPGRRIDERPDPHSPSPAPAAALPVMEDFDMGDGNDMTGVTLDEAPEADMIDERSDLLSHMFNYSPLSKFQASFDDATRWQPVLYRVLNYRPTPTIDREGEYGRYCAELLQACGDATIPFNRLVEIFARCLAGCLSVVAPTLETPECQNFHLEEVVVSTDIISLCARITWLFRGATANGLFEAGIENCLKMLVERIYASEPARTMLQERFDAGIKARITARRPPPPPSPPLIQVNGTQRQAHPQARAVQSVKPRPIVPDVQPEDAWKSWFEELAFAVADMTQALCWFSADWVGDGLVSIALGLTAPHLPLGIVLRGMGVTWAASTFKGNFRYLMMPSATWPSAGGDPVLERLSRYLISPPAGPKDSIHKLTMLMLRSLTMLSISEPASILLVGQQSLVVPALVSVLRRSAVKIWGVCAEDVDGNETMDITSHALYLFHHLLFPRYSNATLKPDRPADDKASYTNDGPDFVVPALPQASQARLPDDDDNARLQGINLVDVVNLHGAKREFVGLGHEFIATMGTIAFAQPVDESHGLDDGEMNSIQDMATAILGELINGYEEDAIYELYDDGTDGIEADEEAADDEAALQDVIVIQDDSD